MWALIQGWADAQRFPPTQAKLAEHLGISKSLASVWKQGGTLPRPEQLRRVSETTRIDYLELLTAALTDAGYLQREELMGNAKHPAPTTDVTQTDDLRARRTRPSRALEWREAEEPEHLGQSSGVEEDPPPLRG